MKTHPKLTEASSSKGNEAELLAALVGCLAQLLGPALVHGDGRGNDGRKTGLSGQEFSRLKAKRIAAARSVIAKARREAKVRKASLAQL